MIDAHDLHTEIGTGLEYRADAGIHTGSVAAAGQYTDSFHFFNFLSYCRGRMVTIQPWQFRIFILNP